MTTPYEKLLTKINELDDLSRATAILSWDRETNMPELGLDRRLKQITTLTQLSHRLSTSDEFGELLVSAETHLSNTDPDPDSTPNRLLTVVRRQFDRARKLPADFVTRKSTVTGKANAAWIKARSASDFTIFQPWLEQVVEQQKEMAELYGYDDEPYDALLNLFELNAKTADVRALFDDVKAAVVPLIENIRENGKAIDASMLHQTFLVENQEKFARFIARAAGYDLARGHIGTVVHPFATSFGRNDVRITSRWHADFLNPGLFGALHEAGHAMYEQGVSAEFDRTPLARGTSSGIHESQSRTIENIVGRSYGFWSAHYDNLQAVFPNELGDKPLADFYRAINKVYPSFIRVEADELTYNFHIILRFELEQALINGRLAVADIPDAWNDKMQSMLGITPPNDAQGCLQDVHWGYGYFGYFPTYALGNLYASQFHEAMLEQNPAIKDELARGEASGINSWLHENIHQHGKKFRPDELALRATGKPLSAEPFIRYVTQKFSKLYEL